MIDRMKLELALAHCVEQHGVCDRVVDCGCCTYLSQCNAAGSPLPVIRDARELIISMQKEREPRLVNADDFNGALAYDECIPCWKETKSPTRRNGWTAIVYGKWLADKGVARYWTGIPTEAQMKEIKWDE